MESLAISTGVLGGLVAAPLFCLALMKLVAPHLRISRAAFWLAIIALILFALEVMLVNLNGAVYAREFIGPAFFPVHALLTLGAAPALACVLLLGRLNLRR